MNLLRRLKEQIVFVLAWLQSSDGAAWARSARVELNALLLRAYAQLVPTEQSRVLLLTIFIGGLCGMAAVTFHLSIVLAEGLFIEHAMAASGTSWIAWTILTPTLGAAICGIVLERWLPAARGSGIPQVKVVYTVKSGRIRLRDAVGKLALATVQIGTGSSLGREGPTVYICAGLASALGRWFAISPVNLRRMIPVGAAAGIAAAFNAPIAAVTFVLEELVGELDQTMLSGIVVAAALAAVIERMVLGGHPVFQVERAYELQSTASLAIYLLLGVCAAVVAVLFMRLLLSTRAAFQKSRIPPMLRPAVGGFITGALAVVAFQFLQARGVTGGGYSTLSAALGGALPLRILICLCVLKLFATVFSYSSGGAGGIFAPTLFVGGMLGGAFGYLDRFVFDDPTVNVGAFALVGMGAVFAGVVRAPITSILIVFEMTNGYGLILPLMIANSTAYFLSKRWFKKPIYEALIEQDGIQLPHKSDAGAALSSLRVEQVMTTSNLVTLAASMSVRSALDSIRGGFSTFPVLDDDGALAGLVSEARLRRRFAEGGGDAAVRDALRPRDVLRASQPLHDAVVRMTELGVRQMAVVDDADARRLVGMFAMSDVFRAHAQAAVEVRDHNRDAVPL
jgi:CIC family chloride channel protein